MKHRTPLTALVISSGISSAGSAMTLIAVPWFVLDTTGSGARTGLTAGVEMLGLFASVALAGPLVDRYGARRTSIVADLFTVAMVAGIPLTHATTGLSFPALLALAFGIGLGRAPSRSARSVLLPETITLAGVPVQRGASAQEGALSAGNLLGAPIGGALIAVVGPTNVLLLDAATLLTAAALVALLVPIGRRPAPEPATAGIRGYLRELSQSVEYVRKDRLLLVVGLLCAGTNALFAGLSSVLIPALGKTVWHDSALAGSLIAAMGAGGLVGTLLYGWLGPRLKRWPTFCASFLLAGPPTYLVLALDLPPVLLVAFVAACAIGNGPLNPVLAGLKFDRVAVEFRGRVFGALHALAIAASPVGTMTAGLLLDLAGPRTAVAVMGVMFVGLMLCPLIFPVWRKMDDPPLVPATAVS